MWYNRNIVTLADSLIQPQIKKDTKYVSLVNQSALWWSSAQATEIMSTLCKIMWNLQKSQTRSEILQPIPSVVCRLPCYVFCT